MEGQKLCELFFAALVVGEIDASLNTNKLLARNTEVIANRAAEDGAAAGKSLETVML